MFVNLEAPNTTSLVLGLFGILSSCGALTWWWRSGTQVSMADRTATEANTKVDAVTPKVSALEAQMVTTLALATAANAKGDALDNRVTHVQTQVTEHGAIITEIRTRMAKLDKVDEMVGAINTMRDVVNGTVPRNEVALQRENDDRRFTRVEDEVRAISRNAKDA